MAERRGTVRRKTKNGYEITWDNNPQVKTLPASTPGAATLAVGKPFTAEVNAAGTVVEVHGPLAPPPPPPSAHGRAVAQARAFLAEEVQPMRGGGEFVNPYVMLQVPDRAKDGTVWGDWEPPRHDRLEPDHCRGTITFTLTAESPLLLLDQSHTKEEIGQNEALRLRRGPDGEVLLDPTSVKGALRSLFEAASVSRFGVFEHPDLLAIRAEARDALKLRPARVVDVGGELKAEVTTRLDPQGHHYDGEPAHEVWVPAYLAHGNVMGHHEHGTEVWAWIHLLQRPSAGRTSAYHIWRASAVAADRADLPEKPPAVPLSGQLKGVDASPVLVRGVLLVGGHSFSKKHDERLYVLPGPETGGHYRGLKREVIQADLGDVRKKWRAVYDSFHAAHENGANPPQHVNHQQQPLVLGRHITNYEAERDLNAGTLGFARLDDEQHLVGLYPVLIGRLPFTKSPDEVLEGSQPKGKPERRLRPARSYQEMSPADRLFGWVGGPAAENNSGVAAHRGHLWVESVVTQNATTRSFEGVDPEGLQLATLNNPKPSQYRFYLKQDNGEPLDSGKDRKPEEGFDAGEERAIPRKFYWRHGKLPDNYWDVPNHLERGPHNEGYQPSRVGNRYREYIAPPGTAPNVTRRIQEWVDRDATFSVTLRFDGGERELLGLLLWLLTTPDIGLAVGGGKPLGFGAVRVSDVVSKTQTGEQVAAALRQWPPSSSERDMSVAADQLVLEALTSIFELGEKTGTAYADNLWRLRQLGNPAGLPVHYPREGRSPVAESYRWFVNNDKGGRDGGRKLPLPDIAQPGLPYNPKAR